MKKGERGDSGKAKGQQAKKRADLSPFPFRVRAKATVVDCEGKAGGLSSGNNGDFCFARVAYGGECDGVGAINSTPRPEVSTK